MTETTPIEDKRTARIEKMKKVTISLNAINKRLDHIYKHLPADMRRYMARIFVKHNKPELTHPCRVRRGANGKYVAWNQNLKR